MISKKEKARYSRNIMLSDFGEEGQEKLKNARVLIIGLGGLGSPIALYLAAAGVGTIGLVDGDRVDDSNLQRQVIYTEDDLGLLKVDAARARMLNLNSMIEVVCHGEYLTEENGAGLIAGYDFVVEATDSVEKKFYINDLCVAAGTPFCHGGVLQFAGQVMTVIPGETACYRCYFKMPPAKERVEAVSFGGILGSMAGTIGAIQASETLKYLSGVGDCLLDSLFICDISSNTFATLPITRRCDCPACGHL